ncbi:MAG: zinc metallopeptidase [Cyanobacteria bacterium P01_A01_bin.135]
MPLIHWSYLLLLPGFALIIWSHCQIRRTYHTYAEVASSLKLTGADVARILLHQLGLREVRVEMVMGELSDHYDPVVKAVRLSCLTYNTASLSATAIAAHECGHALQDQQCYRLLQWRTALLPAVNIGSQLGPLLILLGILLSALGSVGGGLMQVGIGLFSLTLVFHLVTLPVEFDASRRALRLLKRLQLTPRERRAVAKVLWAAAWTYVATTVYAGLQLVQLLVISREQ